MPVDPSLRAAAQDCKAWPFEEARKLLARANRLGKKEVLFETGYGPSGLPHIGTFGEVARTTMVRRAFETLCDIPTRLICFSDDMDGMRKIPENVPDRKALEPHLQRPLTSVPNPFGGDYESFGHHNNAMLRRFLDTFGFEYEFASATDYYKSGRFDAMLLRALEKYDAIMEVMLPTLGEERQQTYSPFLPISPTTGRVLYVPMKKIDARAGTITFADEDGTDVTLEVTGGRTKLQWKPDFGMRWAALGVDFEMFGKDHQTNAPIYDRISEILGAVAPEHYVYELFLDELGQKISKSKGNGLTIDEWLTYADPESLALFMYNKPREAKRLYFDVIPRAVDEYGAFLAAYQRQEGKPAERLMNPAWHIHSGHPPPPEAGGISFALLLNLAAVANAHEKAALWGFIRRYEPHLAPETHPRLDALVGHALRYFDDFVKPKKKYRPPTAEEAQALSDLAKALGELPDQASPEEIQTKVYDVGRREPYRTTQKDGSVGVAQTWFNMLYQVLLGEERGPRFGSFVALYGLANTRALIARAVAGELAR
ncbi:MAG: lysine--tRNA ligase [Alphaproteobacteria bacterium]|nr:lysine--tRNA ligase [Alphaproteobacteria bacterium]